jgi:hypothetical protein
MVGRGAVYGAVLGALCGSAVGLGVFIAGIVWGFPIGLGVGIVIGVLVSLFIGIVTALYFHPLTDVRRYRVACAFICAVVSPVLTALAVHRIWFGSFGVNTGDLLFAVLGFFSSLVFSKKLTNWYISEHTHYELVQSDVVKPK